jgi:hypothetical protein
MYMAMSPLRTPIRPIFNISPLTGNVDCRHPRRKANNQRASTTAPSRYGIPTAAARHNLCSLYPGNKKFQPRQCIAPNSIPLMHPMSIVSPRGVAISGRGITKLCSRSRVDDIPCPLLHRMHANQNNVCQDDNDVLVV